MAAVAGTGTSLSASYYLRNFYTANRHRRMPQRFTVQRRSYAILIMRMTLQTVPIFTEASTHLYKFTITRCHPEIKQMTLL